MGKRPDWCTRDKNIYGISAVQRTRPNLILMDGLDLTYVLESFIDLRDLLKRKLRRAAQTRNIYISSKEFFLET